ncbi:gp67 [Psittacid alphaherpesvirus 1]|uniref:Tegument protein UL47 homolog n=1 Tax=Psittacid herpesvirus 1 (isolate Amazon parrot/-/97-0001/1997) TaxID=670426 RepID=TEG5_PSHV1|nr:tegument protein VP13/14 [Psittacid alphaherpesvirus 1]Q6UDF9.1 RecName: Full=Tegument protein UL47 homolog [Psittacid herpesvirus 1 Amazon parrot/1997]AAQ73751.1 gp67 [Psittacid alphaherpesvirus 1]
MATDNARPRSRSLRRKSMGAEAALRDGAAQPAAAHKTKVIARSETGDDADEDAGADRDPGTRRGIDPWKLEPANDPFASNKEYGGKWGANGPADSAAKVLAAAWDIMALVDAEEVAKEQETFEAKTSPVSPFGAWPGGQSWRTLGDYSHAPILYPSAEVIEADALKVGAYVSRVVQCSRFVADKKAQRPTVRSLQSFLEAAFWRVMQNAYSTCLRLRPKLTAVSRSRRSGANWRKPSPSDPNWYAVSNQFLWRGMRVPSLLLPPDVPIEENAERGPTAAVFRNAGPALFIWPWARAPLDERDKRLVRAALWALDILDAAILASFPYAWRPHVGDKQFEEALDCLAEYFGLAVLLTETVLAALLDHTLAFMKSLGAGNYDDFEEDRFADPGKNKYLMGVEGVSLTRLNSAGTALATVCANTYAALRCLPSVATSSLTANYSAETRRARKPTREDLFSLLQHEALFYTIWLQRMATHLDFCSNVLVESAKKGKQEFPIRRSALVRHMWLQKLLSPLVVPVSLRDFAAAKKEAVADAKIETYVKSVQSTNKDPKGTIRFIASDNVKTLMASYEKYNPILDEPMIASRAFDDVISGYGGRTAGGQNRGD